MRAAGASGPTRIASFNVENMFRRPRALRPATYEENKPILEAYAELQRILEQPVYTAADKKRILKLLEVLGLARSDESEWVVLRKSRGTLIERRPRARVVPDGRADWIGWLELRREAVDEQATRNTARVIADMDADVLALVEAEDRPALDRFNRDVLALTEGSGGVEYRHVMLIDGNDDRGIDVGLMTSDRWPIRGMRSHVDDMTPTGQRLFSRDCPQFDLISPSGNRLVMLVNHFKSKGYGQPAASDARRKAQAERVAEIYRERRAKGAKFVVVAGDLNDTPDSDPMAPLVEGTDLRDISDHPDFDDGGRTGTYGTSRDKIDYLLLSPELFERVEQGGVNRSGVWRGPRVKNPWPMLDTITTPDQAASDHAAIWADVHLARGRAPRR